VVANAAAAAVNAFATAAAAANSGSTSNSQQQSQQQGGQQQQLQPSHAQQQPAAALSRTKSGVGTPREAGRPPSYHDLARAMREYHEQQLAAESAVRAAAATVEPAVRQCNGISSNCPADGISSNGALNVAGLEQSPINVVLPSGVVLDDLLAQVAATAATAAASALNEVMPQRNGQQQQQPVCMVTSVSNCKEESA
jgi:hypothetical protein